MRHQWLHPFSHGSTSQVSNEPMACFHSFRTDAKLSIRRERTRSWRKLCANWNRPDTRRRLRFWVHANRCVCIHRYGHYSCCTFIFFQLKSWFDISFFILISISPSWLLSCSSESFIICLWFLGLHHWAGEQRARNCAEPSVSNHGGWQCVLVLQKCERYCDVKFQCSFVQSFCCTSCVFRTEWTEPLHFFEWNPSTSQHQPTNTWPSCHHFRTQSSWTRILCCPPSSWTLKIWLASVATFMSARIFYRAKRRYVPICIQCKPALFSISCFCVSWTQLPVASWVDVFAVQLSDRSNDSIHSLARVAAECHHYFWRGNSYFFVCFFAFLFDQSFASSSFDIAHQICFARSNSSVDSLMLWFYEHRRTTCRACAWMRPRLISAPPSWPPASMRCHAAFECSW